MVNEFSEFADSFGESFDDVFVPQLHVNKLSAGERKKVPPEVPKQDVAQGPKKKRKATAVPEVDAKPNKKKSKHSKDRSNKEPATEDAAEPGDDDGEPKLSGKAMGKKRRLLAKRERQREERKRLGVEREQQRKELQAAQPGRIKKSEFFKFAKDVEKEAKGDVSGSGRNTDGGGHADGGAGGVPKKSRKNKFYKPPEDEQQPTVPVAQVAPQAEAPKATAKISGKAATAGPAVSAAKGGKKSSSLLDKMRSHLSGGRFRFLNEALYTQPGASALELFQKDPSLFTQYHSGFRDQTAKWPVQPIQVCKEWLAKKPDNWKVADFGCGDAQLARMVKQDVYSFDLVTPEHAPEVVACNIADVPLGNASVNAVVFCLALMGTDYGSFLEEAHRVLVKGGQLWIAEVRSRFEKASDEDSPDVTQPFLQALKGLGFEVLQKDASNKMFVVFVCKKAAGAREAVPWPPLKACTYKRR